MVSLPAACNKVKFTGTCTCTCNIMNDILSQNANHLSLPTLTVVTLNIGTP